MTDGTQQPGFVRCRVSINPLYWDEYGDRLQALREACPRVQLDGEQQRGSPRAKEHRWRDEWGCLWHFPGMYLDGAVVEHPLASWDDFDDWQPPDVGPRVEAIHKQAEEARAAGRPVAGAGFEHGFLFLRLTYLRGFNNFMLDVADEDPRLFELRDIVTDYWLAVAQAHLDCGATHIGGGDDLGIQDRLPISPASWRALIKPGFDRIFAPARERKAEIRLHTDGYIVDIIPDLIELGVTALNPQDLVNGLDTLAALAKGQVHIILDIDRQSVTVLGTPAQVDAHIHNCIRTLGSPDGGLSLVYGVYPGTPVPNIEAAVRAMEACCDMWVR